MNNGEMILEGGLDDRTRSVPRKLQQARYGIPLLKNRHAITMEATPPGGHHGENQNRVGTKRNKKIIAETGDGVPAPSKQNVRAIVSE